MTEAEIKMLSTYTQAIQQAGGSTGMFIKDIDKMTVLEMIQSLAPNGVRFKYVKQNNGT